MTASARFGLPLLQAGQAQKELFHNEALVLIDALVQPCAEGVPQNIPPDEVEDGQCWIVGDSPGGMWSGQAGALAIWTSGGWRFVAPREGMSAWIRSEGLVARYIGSVWQTGTVAAAALTIEGEQVVGARQPGIDEPDGGTVVDAEARAAIEAMLEAMRAHGLIDGI